MMKKIRDWLRAAWLSFQVSQNARRLAFLRNFILGPNQDETSVLACKVIDYYFAKNPKIDGTIWSLLEAQKLLDETRFLIRIMENVAYAD